MNPQESYEFWRPSGEFLFNTEKIVRFNRRKQAIANKFIKRAK